MTLEFFMAMKPPTATYQEKKLTVRNGKPHTYEPPNVRDTREKLTAHLARFAPEKPLSGAVRLVVKWLFPKGKAHKDGEYKTTRPDTDNLIKLLKDCMTELHFWHDDSQVASEINEKFYADTTGIFIRLEEIE
ncbi:MAG: RusA family crossover junction endodeoxyribonuclease [Ruminococcus sp.]|nr:RusA family crossover junction endodeoxyribonuclease [Ruminococcus sp.]